MSMGDAFVAMQDMSEDARIAVADNRVGGGAVRA
jgi:hypothetical protein